jgi:hypothetical protein
VGILLRTVVDGHVVVGHVVFLVVVVQGQRVRARLTCTEGVGQLGMHTTCLQLQCRITIDRPSLTRCPPVCPGNTKAKGGVNKFDRAEERSVNIIIDAAVHPKGSSGKVADGKCGE